MRSVIPMCLTVCLPLSAHFNLPVSLPTVCRDQGTQQCHDAHHQHDGCDGPRFYPWSGEACHPRMIVLGPQPHRKMNSDGRCMCAFKVTTFFPNLSLLSSLVLLQMTGQILAGADPSDVSAAELICNLLLQNFDSSHASH